MRTVSSRVLVVMAILPAALGASGCGDDTAPARDDGGRDDGRDVAADDGGEDVQGEADAEETADEATDGDGGTGTLSVLVSTTAWPDDTETPAEGAVVALDPPGGERIEETTGADGRVTFEGIDWAAGTADVTSYVEGHAIVSRVGVTGADGEVELVLFRPGDPEGLVEVSGNALNMMDEGHELIVSATVPNLSHQATGPLWSIDVVPDVPFTVVGLEAHVLAPLPSGRGIDQSLDTWTVLDHAAVTDPVTADLDFDSPATPTPTTFDGSFTIPSREDSPLFRSAYGYILVSSGESEFTLLAGAPIRIDLAAGAGSFEYTGEYLELPGVVEPMTLYLLTRGTRERSQVWVEGWPTSGPHDPGFLDVPRLVAPAAGARHPLHDPIVWEIFDTGVEVVVNVVRDQDVVWRVDGPVDATTLAIPQPPSSVDPGTVLGTGYVDGRLGIFRMHASDEYAEKWARTDTFIIAL